MVVLMELARSLYKLSALTDKALRSTNREAHALLEDDGQEEGECVRDGRD